MSSHTVIQKQFLCNKSQASTTERNDLTDISVKEKLLHDKAQTLSWGVYLWNHFTCTVFLVPVCRWIVSKDVKLGQVTWVHRSIISEFRRQETLFNVLHHAYTTKPSNQLLKNLCSYVGVRFPLADLIQQPDLVDIDSAPTLFFSLVYCHKYANKNRTIYCSNDTWYTRQCVLNIF